MIEIKNFGPELLYGSDTLMLGGGERKTASFRRTIEMWPDAYPDTALVVFDYSGKLYESCAANAVLADLSSENSVMPDIIEPFVTSERFGATSAGIARVIRHSVYEEIRSRDANDKFFDDLGKLSTERMFTYMLETEKNVLKNMAAARTDEGGALLSTIASHNLWPIFCRQHQYIETLMTKTIGGETDALPVKYRLLEMEAAHGALTREFALSKYIMERELRFQKRGDREELVPFADLLLTNGDNTNTQRCIKMQADANTSNFRALMETVTENTALFAALPAFKLGDYINAPAGRVLFVCSSGNAAADRGFAPMLTAALGAAAQNAGRGAAVLIPELDRWGMLNFLDKFRQSWEELSFVFGYDNFSRLSLESRCEESQLIETLYSASAQRMWHAAEEERLTRAFDSYVSAADVIYRPEDLNDEIRAIERDGSISYVSFAEGPLRTLRSRAKLRRSRKSSPLWITQGAEHFEKLTLESLLEEGETL
ncbi:MAG: hypothetical protein RR091_09415 [Cloacibacillus sp.]